MIPTYLSLMWDELGPAVKNHLWQSTVVLGVVALLTLALRKNQARIRYWLWLAGSIKFLIPFSLLISAGRLLPGPRSSIASRAVLYEVIEKGGQPFIHQAASVTSARATLLNLSSVLPVWLPAMWFAGLVIVLALWTVSWRRVSAAMREGVTLQGGREWEALRRLERRRGGSSGIRLLLSRSSLEPGIFGIARPVLIWPAGISQRLDDAQMEAILAHEMCHVRRRDNLAAAMHMVVEAVFWFHPLVWWLGARLVEERERACDEEVLLLCGEPKVYAESILKVCEFCVESPVACVTGVTGSDLKKRIVNILSAGDVFKLEFGKKLLLAAVGLTVVGAPLAIGVVGTLESKAQSAIAAPSAQTADKPKFEVASIRPSDPLNDHQRIENSGNTVRATVTVRSLIERAYGMRDFQVSGGPKWLDSAKYDIIAKSDEREDPTKLTPAQLDVFIARQQQRLQSLLADRFQLKFHSIEKELPVYALVIAKGGPKLRQPKVDELHRLYTQGPGQLACFGASMSELAAELPEVGISRIVLDRTGVSGNYDFSLRWTPESLDGGTASPEASGPSIFTALQEQLGLKLESATGPVQTLVIDHIGRPSEN